MTKPLKLPTSYEELDKLAAKTTGSICWACDRFESFNGEQPHAVCVECGHVYRNAQEIISKYEENVDWSWERGQNETEVPFCPVCLHDW